MDGWGARGNTSDARYRDLQNYRGTNLIGGKETSLVVCSILKMTLTNDSSYIMYI